MLVGMGGRVFKQYNDAPHAFGWSVGVDRDRRVAFVARDHSIVVYAIIQDGQTAGILVRDYPGELGLGDHVQHEADVRHAVVGSSITRHLDHLVIPVCTYFKLEPVTQGALVKWLVALKQLKVKWDVKPTPVRFCDSAVDWRLHAILSTNPQFCGVPSRPHINALGMSVAPLPGRFPQVDI